jgi:hypothetical protein
MAKNKAAKARQAAGDAWNSPYVQRVVEDPELRQNVRAAVESARSAYGRLTNGKPVAKVVTDDKKFQKDIKQASDSLRDVGDALREGPKKRKRRLGFGRLLLLGIVGAGVALAASEPLRNKVLDALFGAEEEFDYQSTATSPPSSPATETSAAGSTSESSTT